MISIQVDRAVAGQLRAAERAELKRQLGRMTKAAALTEAQGRPPVALEVNLRLVSDATIHELNREYRHKDKPTDVLAFAQRDAGLVAMPGVLGDIIISLDTAYRQTKAPRTRQRVFRELVFLMSHGLCHLLGYDHRDDEEEHEMNARMAKLRAEAERRGRVLPA